MTVNDLLDNLCDLLYDELERQENVLALCRAKHEAMRALDMDALHSRTKALEMLLKETVDAEFERDRALDDVAERLEIPPGERTLSRLVEVVSDPWKGRLRDFQGRLRDTLEKSKAVAKTYSQELRRAIRINDGLVRHVSGGSRGDAGVYGARGVEKPHAEMSLALVDQRG